MKKEMLAASLLLLLGGQTMSAQQQNETKYRRPSLYTMMIPINDGDTDEERIAKSQVIQDTFTGLATPDKYNDHRLGNAVINLSKIEVTDDEIAAVAESGGGKKKGFGKALGGLSKAAGSSASGGTDPKYASIIDDVTGKRDKKYIACILKYFKENHTADSLVYKWYNGSSSPKADGLFFDYNLIAERGVTSASKEDLDKAAQTLGGVEAIQNEAAADLIPRTFVAVSRYKLLTVDDLVLYAQAAASMVPNAMAQSAAMLAAEGLKKVLDGNFVSTSTYLFQLRWTPEIQQDFETNVYGVTDAAKVKEFIDSGKCELVYVGKTKDRTPGTLSFAMAQDKINKIMARATERAQDGAISKLAKEYDQFKTLSTLHVEGDRLFSYIGMKEGAKDGDQFEVLEQTFNPQTKAYGFEIVGKVKVAKGKVWDNRAGAGEQLEGVAIGKDEVVTDASLTATEFEGKAGKFSDGMLLRQVK